MTTLSQRVIIGRSKKKKNSAGKKDFIEAKRSPPQQHGIPTVGLTMY